MSNLPKAMQSVKEGGSIQIPASALGRHPVSLRFIFLLWKMAGIATLASKVGVRVGCDNACAVHTGPARGRASVDVRLLLVSTE